jgi:hypothetical protein
MIPKLKLICFFAFCASFFTNCALFKPKPKEVETVIEPTPVIEKKEDMVVKYAPNGKTAPFLKNLLEKDAFVKNILDKPEDYQVQIIYTQIDRSEKDDNSSQITFSYNEDPKFYFYPASMVKLPIAILALQKINELNEQGIALTKNHTMLTLKNTNLQTAAYNDPTSSDGRPSIAHYIKKIFLTSDNDAFNRLYEFLGQDYINTKLTELGYKSAEIRHRLSIALPKLENQTTNAIKFVDSSGKMIYEQAMQKSNYKFATRKTTRGKGYLNNGKVNLQPFDFSEKNQLNLTDMHQMIKAVVYPQSVNVSNRFNITEPDRMMLLQYMSEYPSESIYPSYNSKEVWDSYVKFNFLGSDKNLRTNKDLRIFNKVGFAYGYITDAGYIINKKDNVEFMLSITIHANNDQIFNDDKYNVDDIALPFMKKVGSIIYEYEKTRKKGKIDFSHLDFIYD